MIVRLPRSLFWPITMTPTIRLPLSGPWRSTLALIAGGLVAGAALAAELPATMTLALKTAQIPTAHVGLVVQPVDGRQPLISHNPRQAMNPASVMKLVTTYAALDLLGPAYTWQTLALVEADPADGVLAGNLYLKGGGDPKLAVEQFTALLRQLRLKGIRHIGGDVVLDRSAFAVPGEDPATFDNKPLRPYNAGPDALLVNFKALTLNLSATDGRVRVAPETPADNLTIDNQLKATNGDCGSDWKDFVIIRPRLDGNGQRLEFSGTFPEACGEKHLSISPFPADLQVSSLFRALWQEQGGSLAGQVRSGTTPPSAKPFARQDSPPLAELIRDINKFSNNVMARQVFLTLGHQEGPATLEAARAGLSQWLADRKLRFPELVLDNGSGLSRKERISADSLSRLLLEAWRSPLMPEYVASLPLVGIDGTMKKRLTASPATGRAHIKTGYLEGVRAAAGYVLDSQGRYYVVVCLINDARANQGAPAIDALLQWVGEQ